MTACCPWSICSQQERGSRSPSRSKAKIEFPGWTDGGTTWSLTVPCHLEAIQHKLTPIIYAPLFFTIIFPCQSAHHLHYGTPLMGKYIETKASLVNNWMFWGKTLYDCTLLQTDWNSTTAFRSPCNISILQRYPVGITETSHVCALENYIQSHWNAVVQGFCTKCQKSRDFSKIILLVWAMICSRTQVNCWWQMRQWHERTNITGVLTWVRKAQSCYYWTWLWA